MIDRNKQVGLVSIENDVTRKIDRHRGRLTRVEFIDLCIDYCFGIERSVDFLSGRSQTDDIRSERNRTADVLRGRSRAAYTRGERSRPVRPVPVFRRPKQVSYITKEDLEEFSNGVKHLMEVALDLFIAYDIEKSTAKRITDDWNQKRTVISERIQKLVRKKPPEAEKVDLPQAYCVKCKKMVDIQNPEEVVLENGTPALKGTCPFSGTPVFRFVKKGVITG